MASPRYGRDRERPHRRGAPGAKRTNPWYLMAVGFFVVYLIFLVRWRFGHVSDLQGSSPSEQLSNLRKASHPEHVQSDDALDVEIAAQLEEQRKMEERALQIPIKVVLSTPVPPTDPPQVTTATIHVANTGTKKPQELEKVAAVEQLERHVPGIPVETAKVVHTVADTGAEKPQELEKVVAVEQLEGHVPGIPVDSTVETSKVVQTEAVTDAVPEQIAPVVEHVAATEVAPVIPTAELVPSVSRLEKISGYQETMKFLENYQYNPDESLFLFFMCSDDQFKTGDWSDECIQGKKHVYDVFSKSPGRNRLVTVFAGSEKYWKHQNDFYNNPDLRVKGVPCIMQWEGRNGRTSGMLVHSSLYDEPFLRYLFKNTDQPEVLFPAESVKNKQIITVNGYKAYADAMVRYEQEENPVPTFLMMVSGRFKNNNRPWCPYCRYSELPIEYAFYHYAPKNSRMIRVEVTNSYSEWKKRNEFTRDENLKLKLVPLMYAIQQVPPASLNGTKSIKCTPHKVRYDQLATLRQLFISFA